MGKYKVLDKFKNKKTESGYPIVRQTTINIGTRAKQEQVKILKNTTDEQIVSLVDSKGVPSYLFENEAALLDQVKKRKENRSKNSTAKTKLVKVEIPALKKVKAKPAKQPKGLLKLAIVEKNPALAPFLFGDLAAFEKVNPEALAEIGKALKLPAKTKADIQALYKKLND